VLSLFEDLSPHARVATAVAPFAAAVVLRVVLGKNRLTRALISLGTMWFAINVLMAPYSARMRQDITDLRYFFR
jgi:hypothetical protein